MDIGGSAPKWRPEAQPPKLKAFCLRREFVQFLLSCNLLKYTFGKNVGIYVWGHFVVCYSVIKSGGGDSEA